MISGGAFASGESHATIGLGFYCSLPLHVFFCPSSLHPILAFSAPPLRQFGPFFATPVGLSSFCSWASFATPKYGVLTDSSSSDLTRVFIGTPKAFLSPHPKKLFLPLPKGLFYPHCCSHTLDQCFTLIIAHTRLACVLSLHPIVAHAHNTYTTHTHNTHTHNTHPQQTHQTTHTPQHNTQHTHNTHNTTHTHNTHTTNTHTPLTPHTQHTTPTAAAPTSRLESKDGLLCSLSDIPPRIQLGRVLRNMRDPSLSIV